MSEANQDERMVMAGTRIRFLRDIGEDACGDHPAYVLARKGKKGTVVGHSPTWGYSVKWDAWQSAAFGATLGTDFEVIPRVLP